MKCGKCGNEYPSQYYFAAPDLCKNCFDKLPENERSGIIAQAAQYYPVPDELDFRVGFGRRVGAYLLDIVLVVIALVAALMLTGVGAELIDALPGTFVSMSDYQQFQNFAVEKITPLFIIIAIIYYSMEIFFAATPGKMVLGITIDDAERKPASKRKLFKRCIIKHADLLVGLVMLFAAWSFLLALNSLFTIVIFIGFFLVLMPKRQALHDILAQTAVYFKEDVINEIRN